MWNVESLVDGSAGGTISVTLRRLTYTWLGTGTEQWV